MQPPGQARHPISARVITIAVNTPDGATIFRFRYRPRFLLFS
jgi:hypothetical protein